MPPLTFSEPPERLQFLSDVAVEHPSMANSGRAPGDAIATAIAAARYSTPGAELLQRSPPPPPPRTLWTVAGERQVVAASD